MKKFVIIFSLVLLVVLSATSAVFADLPGTGWWSALFVQNIGADDGSLNMTAYEGGASSTIYGSSPFPFDFGEALIYDPGKAVGGSYIGFSSNLPPGFEGSVVLEASVPVAAISEIANYNNGSVGGGGTASARYQGMSADAVADTLFVPSIKNNYVNHTTTLYVQAAGADADVTVSFNMNNGQSYTQTKAITANKMFVFDPSNAGVPSTNCGTNSNKSQCYGSAEITSSTGPIAATVVEHPHFGSPAGYALSTRALTPSDFDTKIFHPTIKNEFYDIMTAGASVMNVGNADALVKITLTVTGKDPASTANIGQTFTDTEVIKPGEAKLFSKWLDNIGGMPRGTFAAATIESIKDATHEKQPLVGATNDSKVLPAIPGSSGITLYAGFADGSKTDTIAAPIVRENFSGLTGGLTVQNVGTSGDKIWFEYYPVGSTTPYVFRTTNNVAVGRAVNTNQISSQKDKGLFTIVSGFTNFSQLNNKQFSVIAYTEGGQPIIGLASEYAPANNRDMSNYETINFRNEDLLSNNSD